MNVEKAKTITRFLSETLGEKFVLLFEDDGDMGMITHYDLEELNNVLSIVLDTLDNGEIVKKDTSKLRKLDC